MSLCFEPIRAEFGARVSGVNLHLEMSAPVFAELRRALDEYSVLVFSNQPLDDERQVAFSRWWGPLEPTKGVNPASGTYFARQSNLDIATGTIIPPSDRRMDYQRGNYLWHADSTFKPVPSLCSILTAREVPTTGGNTEFVSTRAAYEALTADEQRELDPLTVVHDFSESRAIDDGQGVFAEAHHDHAADRFRATVVDIYFFFQKPDVQMISGLA